MEEARHGGGRGGLEEGVRALLAELPRASSGADVFAAVADHVERMFAGVTHVSVLLLPRDPGAGAVALGGSDGGRAPPAEGGGAPEPSAKLQGLDWCNCCVFRLTGGRGAVVQEPPAWPVACTAACHAAVAAGGVVVTGDYAARGPHFLDWKSLAEQGAVSMAAVPMFARGRPVAVLCLASSVPHAFGDAEALRALGGVLSPYCGLLSVTSRRAEMARLVSDAISPIAAQLAAQKQHSQLAALGVTVEARHVGAGGACVAVGGQGQGGAAAPPRARRRGAAAPAQAAAGAAGGRAGKGGAGSPGELAPADGGITHKRFESVVVKGRPCDAGGGALGGAGSPWWCEPGDPDCGDFVFNLISMAVVYVYFSKAVVGRESLAAILLCMGVAALDVLLLLLRWVWYEQYVTYGGVLSTLLAGYRAVVLPLANSLMTWSLLSKSDVKPGWPVVMGLGVALIACVAAGSQVRFFLHAPLQLVSVLFVATSTPDVCDALVAGGAASLRCVGAMAALQLSLGLVLPSVVVAARERLAPPSSRAERGPADRRGARAAAAAGRAGGQRHRPAAAAAAAATAARAAAAAAAAAPARAAADAARRRRGGAMMLNSHALPRRASKGGHDTAAKLKYVLLGLIAVVALMLLYNATVMTRIANTPPRAAGAAPAAGAAAGGAGGPAAAGPAAAAKQPEVLPAGTSSVVGAPEVWAAGPRGGAAAAALAAAVGPEALASLKALCGRCLYRTLTSYVRVHDFGRLAVVLTGDIPAMWLRDSAVQMATYLPRLGRRPGLRPSLEGAIRAQAYFILQDPWANAYNPAYVAPSSLKKNDRQLGRGGWVWTRNFELDSVAYFFNFLWNYHQTPGVWAPGALLAEPLVHDAVVALLRLLQVEQHHEARSPYRYSELPRDGLGPPCGVTGMVWSAFRPSDDPQQYSYNVPDNMYLWGALSRLAKLNAAVWRDPAIAASALALMADVHAGIVAHGIVEPSPGVRMYAYEVDGLGHSLHDFDDPNLPSLLALPLLGYEPYDRAVYATTRARILSKANPYFFAGTELHGLGSPHTSRDYVWPLATAVEALTTDEPPAQAELLKMLLKMAAGNGLVHESVHVSSVSQFTRPEFGWANAMTVVALEALLGVDCDAEAEAHRLAVIGEREAREAHTPANGGKDIPAYYEQLEAGIVHAHA
ncbi:mug157-like protein [Scenedesmus sp. PABB004]|nr:mug157-like protein [Scenedesmus sp. PABB004]